VTNNKPSTMTPAEIQSARDRARLVREERSICQRMAPADGSDEYLLLAADVEALARALVSVTADRDHLKRREQDIISATEPADGGQWRADIVGAIQRVRRERDEARAAVETVRAEEREAFRPLYEAAMGLLKSAELHRSDRRPEPPAMWPWLTKLIGATERVWERLGKPKNDSTQETS
jgi:hypothetical protein